MKIVCIIQARMGSSRLPGKVAMKLGQKPMLARVLERAGAIKGVDSVVVATSTKPSDLTVVEIANKMGVEVFRGSEHDVLERYAQAAEEHDAEAIVRITADCPLLDPKMSSEVIRKFVEKKPDYCSNSLRRTFPRGLDTEIFTRRMLDLANQEATEQPDREHVTRFIWRQPQRFNLLSVEGEKDLSGHRWTVDTEQDFALVKKIYQELGEGEWGLAEVLDVLKRNPIWISINADVKQKEV